MPSGYCRDCSKCVEAGVATAAKRSGNALLIICTLGMSVVISSIFKSFRKTCRQCGHPLSWHKRRVDGSFID